jgi:hypothetical protein
MGSETEKLAESQARGQFGVRRLDAAFLLLVENREANKAPASRRTPKSIHKPMLLAIAME